MTAEPSDFEQLMVELVNRARADPVGEIDRLIAQDDPPIGVQPNITSALTFFDVDISLLREQLAGTDPVAPVAWSEALGISSFDHSVAMVGADEQSHQVAGEDSLGTRVENAGYTSFSFVGENLFAFTEDAVQGHAAFYIDWGDTTSGIQDPPGHRLNILDPTFTEVGIGVVENIDPALDIGPNAVTEDFGNRFSTNPFLTGVVIDDLDGDDFYDIGEGLGNVRVTATLGDGTEFQTATYASGGYTLELAPGTYRVTFSGDALGGTVTDSVTMGTENVKLDTTMADALAPLIQGDDAAETLFGTADADTVLGAGGDDLLYGGGGEDSIDGGPGNDTIFGAPANDAITGGIDDDEIYGGGGADFADGADGDDLVFGASGDDFVKGGIGIDTVYGGVGNDRVDGGDGDDHVFGAGGNDSVTGDLGDDTVNGGAGNDTVDGGDDADLVLGASGDDILLGGDGDDLAYGGAGIDSVGGGLDNDELYGGIDADTVDGGSGDDLLFGAIGNDSVLGGDGNDEAYGGSGADTLDGGGGADSVFGAPGDDSVAGGSGDDRVFGGTGADRVEGGDGADQLFGGAQSDLVLGGADNDLVLGGTGDDSVAGDAGDDHLFGQAGDDVLIGGAGDDILDGGPGADRFLFEDALFGNDTISGWVDGVDLLDLTPAGLSFSDFTETASAGGTLLELTTDPGQSIFLVGIDPDSIDATDLV